METCMLVGVSWNLSEQMKASIFILEYKVNLFLHKIIVYLQNKEYHKQEDQTFTIFHSK